MSKQGSNYLPPGFRFKPRDDELINHYLKPRILGQKLPCNIINDDIQVYAPDSTPWLLFDLDDPDSWIDSITNAEKTLYVFTSLSNIATDINNTTTRTRKNTSKKAGCGTWVQRSKRVPIVDGEGNVIGGKRMMNFKIHDIQAGFDLDKAVYFKMHEYSLWGVNENLASDGGDNLVLCKITFDPCKKSHCKLATKTPDQVSRRGRKPYKRKQSNKNLEGSSSFKSESVPVMSSNVCQESTSSHPGSLVALDGGVGSGDWFATPSYDIKVQDLDEFVPVMSSSNVFQESTSLHPGSLVALDGGFGNDNSFATPSYDIKVQNLDQFVPVMSSNVYQESTSSHPGSLVTLDGGVVGSDNWLATPSYDIGVQNLVEFGDVQGGEGLCFGSQGGEDLSLDFFDISAYMEDNPQVESLEDGTICGLGKRKSVEGDYSCRAKKLCF